MFALRTLDRYILREVALTWVAVTGVLLVILLFNQLARVLSQAAANEFPRATVLALLGLTSLQNLTIVLPVGLFLAIMLALGRLYHESEMAAIQSCGIGPAGLYRPVLVLAAGVVSLLIWIAFSAAPAAARKAQDIRVSAMKAAQFGQLEAGRFRSFAGGEIVFYAERVDDNGILHNVLVERSAGPKIEVVTAARAEQRNAGEADQTFVLYEGERFEGVPGVGESRLVRFSEHGIPIRLPEPNSRREDTELMSSRALLASGSPGDRAELQWRISVPLMTLILALMAVPLSRLRPRQGRYGKMGLAILIYFLYSNVLAAARVWVEKESVSEFIGVWWVHLIALALTAWTLARHSGWRPFRSRSAA